MEEDFMDQKKVNLTLIFSLILFGIGIAYKSIAIYFGGILAPYGSFGIPFVAVLVFSVLILIYSFKNAKNRRRLLDILILTAISLIFALVAYCSTEWVSQLEVNIKDIKFVNEWCIAYSIFSSIFFIYALLRYISEISDKKWTFFEIILGLKKVENKTKISEKYNRQPKEVMNGDLEQKPNKEVENNEVKEEKEPEVKESEHNLNNSTTSNYDNNQY